jgi:hypothetical protein
MGVGTRRRATLPYVRSPGRARALGGMFRSVAQSISVYSNSILSSHTGVKQLRPTKALHDRLLGGRFLVALPPSKDLFFGAKHLFVEAMQADRNEISRRLERPRRIILDRGLPSRRVQ